METGLLHKISYKQQKGVVDDVDATTVRLKLVVVLCAGFAGDVSVRFEYDFIEPEEHSRS
jgi:hypothetical protein